MYKGNMWQKSRGEWFFQGREYFRDLGVPFMKWIEISKVKGVERSLWQWSELSSPSLQQILTLKYTTLHAQVDVAELRKKLQSMETLQKELDLLQRQKAASDEAAVQAVQKQQSTGVWSWLAGNPLDAKGDEDWAETLTEHTHTYTHARTYICMYIYLYIPSLNTRVCHALLITGYQILTV